MRCTCYDEPETIKKKIELLTFAITKLTLNNFIDERIQSGSSLKDERFMIDSAVINFRRKSVKLGKTKR